MCGGSSAKRMFWAWVFILNNAMRLLANGLFPAPLRRQFPIAAFPGLCARSVQPALIYLQKKIRARRSPVIPDWCGSRFMKRRKHFPAATISI